jgi:hypothetical protein
MLLGSRIRVIVQWALAGKSGGMHEWTMRARTRPRTKSNRRRTISVAADTQLYGPVAALRLRADAGLAPHDEWAQVALCGVVGELDIVTRGEQPQRRRG